MCVNNNHNILSRDGFQPLYLLILSRAIPGANQKSASLRLCGEIRILDKKGNLLKTSRGCAHSHFFTPFVLGPHFANDNFLIPFNLLLDDLTTI